MNLGFAVDCKMLKDCPGKKDISGEQEQIGFFTFLNNWAFLT